MAGIQLIQSGVPYNAAGVQHPGPISVAKDVLCYLSFVGGTTSTYAWALPTRPSGSNAVISSANSPGPTFLPDVAGGSFVLTLTDQNGTIYQLDIGAAAAGVAAGASFPVVINAASYGFSATASAAANTAALMAAVTAAHAAGGGIVELPAGEFSFLVPALGATAGCFFLSGIQNVTIRGAGKYTTTLRDVQAAASVMDDVGNVNGRNAFLTFEDCTGVRVQSIGFHGAMVWNQATISNVVVSSARKAVYWKSTAVGTTDCSVTDCYATLVEGEAFYCDGSASFPVRNLHIDRNHAYRCLTNIVNFAIGTPSGLSDSSGDDNVIESPGNGSPFQGGGQNFSFSRNKISMEAGIDVGADLILISNATNARFEDNDIYNFRHIAGTSIFRVGLPGNAGTSSIALRRNKVRSCLILNTGNAGIFKIDSSAGFIAGVTIEDNEIIDCGDANFGAYPGSIAINFCGSNAIDGVVGGNRIDSGSVTHGIATGVNITAGVPSNNGIIVNQNVISSTVTNPYTFAVAPASDRTYVSGSKTWDPPNVLNATQTTTTVTVTGAALGDLVTVGFSNSLQGMVLTGYVSAANTVTVTLRNDTGGALDLASGTLRARCTKS